MAPAGDAQVGRLAGRSLLHQLDALLKHYDIVWQPSPPSGISVELEGHGHSHELPKPKDDGSSSTADE